MKKTLEDCARCDHLTNCDAHMAEGTYKHKSGNDPCQVSIKDDNKYRKKKSDKIKTKRCKCR